MNEVDRYLKRATRGLWGQKKRDAQAELRGAVEDKMYRCRLLGLDEAQALASALRDLGSPAAISRELGEVHTVPQTLKVLAFVGVAGLLGLQAVAQVGTVRAIPYPQQAPVCTFEAAYLNLFPKATSADVQRQLAQPGGRRALEEAALSKLPASEASEIRGRLAQPGGREALTAECLASSPTPGSQLLRLSDVFAALRARGVGVTPIEGADGLFHLTFPSESSNQLLNLNQITQKINGEEYVGSTFLMDRLLNSVAVPIQISGLQNPVLTIGPAKLKLGSSSPPLFATDLYGSLLLDRLESQLPKLKGQPYGAVYLALDSLNAPNKLNQLRVNTPDGTLYGLLSNADFTRPVAASGREHLYSLSVRAVQGGLLPTPLTYGRDTTTPKLVSTLPELLQATEKGECALLVYRLNATDLHDLKYTPVPAAQLRVSTAR